MTGSRAARQSLAVVLSALLLYPSLAAAGDLYVPSRAGSIELPTIKLGAPAAIAPGSVNLEGIEDLSFAAPARLSGSAAAATAPAVDAHPVLSVINQLQAQGALPQSLSTFAEAQQLEAGAQTLPAGPLRDKIVAMARAAAAAQSGGSAGELNEAYENSKQAASAAAEAPAAPAGFLSRLLPSGLRPAPKAVPQPQVGDPKLLEVPLSMLSWTPDSSMLPDSTRSISLDTKKPIVGQDNALKAIYFGLKMTGRGYNLYVSGPDGSGRETALRSEAAKVAATMPTPGDRVAVTDLGNPGQPLILDLPAGAGQRLSAAMEKFVKVYPMMLMQALSSPDVVAAKRKRKAEFDAAVKARHEAFDAEVAKVRFADHFGIRLQAEQDEEGNLKPRLTILHIDADGKTSVVDSDEKAQVDSASHGQTRSFDELIEQARQAAEPFIEQLEQLAMQDMREGMAGNEDISKIDGMTAAQVVKKLAPSVVGVIGGHNADTPQHKAWEERAKKRAKEAQDAFKTARVGEYGFILTPRGPAIVKFVGDKPQPVSPEEIQQKMASGELSQDAIQQLLKPLMEKFEEVMALNEKEHQELHKDEPGPSREALMYVESLMQYAANEYQAFLPMMQGNDPMAAIQRARLSPEDIFRVDVLSDNGGLKGAPVIFENNPTYERLFGTLDESVRQLMLPKQGMVGVRALRPEIKTGSYFRANGGILVLNVMDALREPGVWPALMRAVRNGEAEITDSLMPMMRKSESVHVKANVKVVLIGSPMIKMLLAQHDDTFGAAFNAGAEFESKLSVEKKEEAKKTVDGYLQFFKKAVLQAGDEMMDFTRDGMAALMQFAAREVSSNTKVTAQFGRVYGLMKEAAFWAREDGSKEVRGEHVQAALQARSDRTETYQKHMVETYQKGVFRVDVSGEKVGQINGLVVAGGTFGLPQRVVATNSAAKGLEVTWSDQAAEWLGNSAKKSFADVKAFLRNEFAQDKAINAHINISFPQIYGGLDGDSATSTMMYAVLSSLSGVPIKQTFAVTGSADPFGNVQVIGGANEKTEGFFAVATEINRAHEHGLNAVIVPWMNAGDLQLKPEVVQAVREGKFKIYRVKTIAQGMELLTGVPFETIKAKAAARLAQLSGEKPASQSRFYDAVPE